MDSSNSPPPRKIPKQIQKPTAGQRKTTPDKKRKTVSGLGMMPTEIPSDLVRRKKPVPDSIDPLDIAKKSLKDKARNKARLLHNADIAKRRHKHDLNAIKTADKIMNGESGLVTPEIMDALPVNAREYVEQENVIFKPNPGPQTEFLAANEDEVFFGGSRGGGKSQALIVDPLYNCHNKHHRALILRRTMPELRDLISKSHSLYPKAFPGCKWREQEKEWRFPSGARIEFGYAENLQDALRYQGQSYCVAAGTFIQMADGSLKTIQTVEVGDMVRTPEGPCPVLATMPPRLDDCVLALVWRDGTSLPGLQVQPAKHPILTIEASPSESLECSSQSVPQSPSYQVGWSSYTQLLDAHLGNADSCDGSTDRSGCYEAIEQSNQESQPPLWLSFPVGLLEPDLTLETLNHKLPIEYRGLDKSPIPSGGSSEETLRLRLGLLQLSALSQSLQDYEYAMHRPDACDVPCDLSETRKALDFLNDCLFDHYSHGVQLRSHSVGAQDAVPLQAYAEELAPFYLPSDERDYILSGSRSCQFETYTHPYTQEQRPLASPVELGICHVVPFSKFPVYDLTIGSSNSYTGIFGFVNKNTWIGVDELPQFPTLDVWNFLRSSNRSPDPSLKAVMRATGNPGNIGSTKVKEMFIDPAPPNTRFEERVKINVPGQPPREAIITRKYIPSTVFDNPYLMHDDSYIATLASLPEIQRRQFLEGDWDAFDGAAFSDFKADTHVIEPFELPSSWLRFRAADWGFTQPAVCLWFAIDHDNRLFVYRELYTSGKTADEFARMVLDYEQGEMIRYGVLDSSCWAHRGDRGPSIAETMIQEGCRWRQADRSPGSRRAGKMELHKRLRVDDRSGEPNIFFLNNCRNTIKTLPVLPIDASDPEDVDTRADDHCYDALRYGIMSRPISIETPYDRSNPNRRHSFTPADRVFGY